MPIIQAFNDIKRKPLLSKKGEVSMDDLRNVMALQIGAGSRALKVDQSGQWMGAKKFVDAPFSVTPAGDVVATSVVLGSNYSKIHIFNQDAIPTSISIGDLWFDTNDKNKVYIAESVGANEITAGEWVIARDTDIAQAISDAAGAQATADGKVVTFYQDEPPTAEGTGDLWIDTNDGNKLYRWSGAAWTEVQDDDIAQAIADAATAQSTADGKIVTFYQDAVPTATDAGDLWIDTNDNNKLYRATAAGDDEVKEGEWEAATLEGVGQNFVSTLVWTATDQDTATWAGGTIKTSDGVVYSIDGGNTGNIAAKTYIYLDPGTSATVLQTSTTAGDAVGNQIILIAIVQDGGAGAECIIDVVGSAGTTIDGGRIITGSITASQIAANTITASEIAATTITATELNVSTLSSITANMGTLTAGSITAGSITSSAQITVGGVSMVGSGIGVDNATSVAFKNTGGSLYGFVSYAGDNIFKLGTLSSGSKVYLVANGVVACEVQTSGGIRCFYDLSVDDDIYIEDDIYPNDDNSSSSLGFGSRYWLQVYAHYVKYKDLGAFQEHDDIAMIKKIKMKEIDVQEPKTLDKDGKEIEGKMTKKDIWDETTVPKEIYEDGFYDAGAVSGLLIGTLKQIIDRIEKIEAVVML